MIKKQLLLILAVIVLIPSMLKADEGMWLLSLIKQINYKEMKKKGCKLTPEQIYNVNGSSLKDAIVALDYGSCTAELISAEGLILTNHHCGYDEIQNHSSVEHDYLSDGFWAKTKADELPNPGKTATFVVRMEDVTEKVLEGITEFMSEEDREAKIEENSEKLKEEAIKDTHYEAQVKSFYEGNEYYLFVLETFTDVRLVGAPPESIGKFGHDTDNWMWPRHTGDFSIFRIYTDPDGKPAEFSEDNIPLKSKYIIPISLKGVDKNDFTMIMGFPGTTNRFLTSYGVQEVIDVVNPIRVKLRGAKQEIITEDMASDKEIRIKYAAKYAQSSNYWKYSIGQNKGLKRLKVVEEKQNYEAELKKWIEADPKRKEKYGKTLDIIKEAYDERAKNNFVMQYINEAFFGGPDLTMFVYQGLTYQRNLQDAAGDPGAIKAANEDFLEKIKNHFNEYNADTDKKIMAELFRIYSEDVDKEFYPEIFTTIEKDYEGNFNAYVNELFKKSIFTNEKRLTDFVNKVSFDEFMDDVKFIQIAYLADMLYDLLQQSPGNIDGNAQITDIVIKGAQEYFTNYDMNADKEAFVALLEKYAGRVPKNELPAIFNQIETKYNNDFKKYADDLFSKSMFTDKDKFEKMLKTPQHDAVYAKLNILQLADVATKLHTELSKPSPSKEAVNKSILELQLGAITYFAGLDKGQAKKQFVEIFEKVYKNADKDQLPSIYKTIDGKYSGNLDAFAKDLFDKSMFANQELLNKFIAKPKAKTLEKDLAFQTMLSIKAYSRSEALENDPGSKFFLSIEPNLKTLEIESDMAYRATISILRLYFKVDGDMGAANLKLDKGKRLFVAAKLKKEEGKAIAPDANSSIRLTYGKVGDYEPRDGAFYKHFTTLKGVMEKEDPKNPEFVVDEKLKKLYEKKDYGRYGEKGRMPVCFTTNNDITGGNSGSPVFDAYGRLIGVAFDGNWEAMSGDIAFEDELQKCICVDIRYVLFIIDKFAGAQNLIDEMKIVK